MPKTFEAVYENGVLKPLVPLDLANRQHVQVTIAPLPDLADDIAAYFDPEEWEASKRDDVSLHEVRRALASIRGSLSDAVIASRDERL
jgi:predicted DNA-binding antitoxin AbrB/MazE fold protein